MRVPSQEMKENKLFFSGPALTPIRTGKYTNFEHILQFFLTLLGPEAFRLLGAACPRQGGIRSREELSFLSYGWEIAR